MKALKVKDPSAAAAPEAKSSAKAKADAQAKAMRDVRKLQDKIDEENAKVLDLESRIAGLKGQIKHHNEEICALRSDQRRIIRGEPLLPFDLPMPIEPAKAKKDKLDQPGEPGAEAEAPAKATRKSKKQAIVHERASGQAEPAAVAATDT